jgi:hypothetical protein
MLEFIQYSNSQLKGSLFPDFPLDLPKNPTESQNPNQSSELNTSRILLEKSHADLSQKKKTLQTSEAHCLYIQSRLTTTSAHLSLLTSQMHSVTLSTQAITQAQATSKSQILDFQKDLKSLQLKYDVQEVKNKRLSYTKKSLIEHLNGYKD